MFILKRAPSIFAIAPSALKNAEGVTSGRARTSDAFGIPNSRLRILWSLRHIKTQNGAICAHILDFLPPQLCPRQ
jgi:hypothetical protein